MKVISVRFNQGDQDLQEYFSNLEAGKKSEQAKLLIRRGLAVQGIDVLQQLVQKGVISSLQVSLGGQPQFTAASKEDEELFIKNMARSWED